MANVYKNTNVRSPGARRVVSSLRAQAAVMAELQRSRLLGAALEEASVRGCNQTSVAAIIARARVSRKTFYELFEGREDCFTALFEDCIAQMAGVLSPAYAVQGRWSERLRAALVELLAFLESDREMGLFVSALLAGTGYVGPDLRARVLEPLTSAVDEGRLASKSPADLSPLAGQFVVGGALTIVHTRLQESERGLSALVNPLMWMIVLPYLGPAAAARELRRALPKPVATSASPAARPPATPPKPARGPLDDLDMRVTYRTARVLAGIADAPGASNVEVATAADVLDPGQISKLLARLANLGLIHNVGVGQIRGGANAWHLTPRGSEVHAAISHELALGQLRASR
jgi:AcrR family transcriptional regulator